MFVVNYLRGIYGRFERPISSLSLILGFVFDAFTLQRVDALWENIWVFGHLLIVGIFIVLVNIRDNKGGEETDPTKAHFWYVNILQFFFGGILSTYLVFYFRSADMLVTWPFILILVVAFWANESLKRHYIRLSFQISLFFLSIYSFAIFLVPVVTHKIGPEIFLLSGLLSLLFIAVFIFILFLFIKEKFSKSRNIILFLITAILITVNILYFTNLIPPIPLSLKDAGVFQSLERGSDGNYTVQYEDLGFGGYFQLYQNFKETLGASVYAYSAVFSPSNLNTTIVHEWQHLDEASGKWISSVKIFLPVIGGRGGGFRTFSVRSGLLPGKWRVNVETPQGQLIGRLRFNVVPVLTKPVLTTDTK